MIELGDDELDRYARHIVLPQVGGAGQQRLKAARVAVIGAGGIGCALLPALAGAGVGRLTIIDGDRVELSNLQRQPLYRTADLGQPKAALAAAFITERNPHVAVTPVEARIDAANAAALLAGHDLVIDGTDNFATRLVVSDAAGALHLPLELLCRGAEQGSAERDTGVGDDQAGSEIVGAVDDEVMVGEQVGGVARVDLLLDARQADVRVAGHDIMGREPRLGHADLAGVEDRLALEVAQFDQVAVDDGEVADAGAGQGRDHRRADAARADDCDAGRLQPLLPDPAELRQRDMARIAVEFVVA